MAEVTDDITLLIPPLTHEYNLYHTEELNPTDKDIPHSNRLDSGYILLLITLIIAKDVTLNNNHPNNYPHHVNLHCSSSTFQQMYTIESSSPTYSPLTREWVDNIITHKQDLITSLPLQLRSLYDSITRTAHKDSRKTPMLSGDSSSSHSNKSIEDQMSIG